MLKWNRVRNDNGGVEYHSTKNNVVIKRNGKKFICTYLSYGVITGNTVTELKRTVEWVLSQKKNRGSMLNFGVK